MGECGVFILFKRILGVPIIVKRGFAKNWSVFFILFSQNEPAFIKVNIFSVRGT